MADVNKIQRSKELIAGVIDYLKNTAESDEKTTSFINNLQLSMQVIDNKMEKFKSKNDFGNKSL